MEEISNFRNEVSSEDMQILLDTLLERESAQKKREELSEESFKEWIYDYLRNFFKKLGYTIIGFEEFCVDLSLSVKDGWKEGADLAHREAELKRRKRERKRR